IASTGGINPASKPPLPFGLEFPTALTSSIDQNQRVIATIASTGGINPASKPPLPFGLEFPTALTSSIDQN
ncbi:hypothetical protein VS883_28770, partial [Escherichia coli]